MNLEPLAVLEHLGHRSNMNALQDRLNGIFSKEVAQEMYNLLVYNRAQTGWLGEQVAQKLRDCGFHVDELLKECIMRDLDRRCRKPSKGADTGAMICWMRWQEMWRPFIPRDPWAQVHSKLFQKNTPWS
jgi:hypothetical protein